MQTACATSAAKLQAAAAEAHIWHSVRPCAYGLRSQRNNTLPRQPPDWQPPCATAPHAAAAVAQYGVPRRDRPAAAAARGCRRRRRGQDRHRRAGAAAGPGRREHAQHGACGTDEDVLGFQGAHFTASPQYFCLACAGCTCCRHTLWKSSLVWTWMVMSPAVRRVGRGIGRGRRQCIFSVGRRGCGAALAGGRRCRGSGHSHPRLRARGDNSRKA